MKIADLKYIFFLSKYLKLHTILFISNMYLEKWKHELVSSAPFGFRYVYQFYTRMIAQVNILESSWSIHFISFQNILIWGFT